MKYISIVLICLLFASNAYAQDKSDNNDKTDKKASDETSYFWSNKREVGIDFTPLISSFIPFNLAQNERGFIGLKTKFYEKKYALRLTFGADALSDQNNNFFYGGIGYERRRNLYKKFTYTSGWDLAVLLNENTTNGSLGFLGLSRFYGLEYNLNEKMFVGTEAHLRIGFPGIQFSSPTSIFMNYRF